MPQPTNAKGATKKADRLFTGYRPLHDAWDEIFEPTGEPRRGMRGIVKRFDAVGRREFRARQRLADSAFLEGGVTFSVYSDERGVEKVFPFDLVPRVISAREWERLERGLIQRITALNAFIGDVYGERRIVDAGVIPGELIDSCAGHVPLAREAKPIGGVYVHVAGIDLIRAGDGRLLVLEDNLRTPSGVSYVLENRSVMKRVFPRVFAASRIQPVLDYPTRLAEALRQLAPATDQEPVVVVLTPGPFNSAYFEHGFLARTMGVEMVHGSDLFVHKKRVYMRTTRGATKVDVIYRRVDDQFIDPKRFRKDSLLGVPGLFDAYAEGNVTLANALGNGVADDKAIYPFVPKIIRFYLDEEPLLGQVETRLCALEEDRRVVLDDLARYVVKQVDGAGGYGMLIGPSATQRELREFATRIRKTPRQYIAQPRVELSTCPTWVKGGVAPRRVDLRPYIVTGRTSWVLPGGLTRVALVDGSYVVNSSQGGGSKDTWVLQKGTSA